MYGLVNKAAQDFVIEGHGEEVWQIIKAKAGVKEEAFVSMQPYPDEITYNIVGAASAHLGADPDDILEAFGQYWIKFTMVEGYSHLLDLAGGTFPEFLNNLNNMHAHIAQSFTELRPPTFYCEVIDANTFKFDYHSDRPGLRRFVKGLLLGLGGRFKIDVNVEYIGNIDGKENSHEYRVTHKS
ncbi:MAG: heme NO-binding domain-containing protein [Flavobacteriaceae bacterium]|nr:heme NO-binding domain-containing protein [Flavobacteriaceae bacterium]